MNPKMIPPMCLNFRWQLCILLMPLVLVLGACNAPQTQTPDHGHHNSMDLGPGDEAVDLRFIDGMILHHQGAIAMAEELAAKSQRSEMQQLAQAIITEQQQEIAQMETWRKSWYPQASPTPMMYHGGMGHMMAMDVETQQKMRMAMPLGPADEKLDLRFIQAMIPHHEGAVVMAEQILGKSKRPELQQLAKEIITAQTQEIEQMKQWQKQWYNL